jgi:RNA polymerase primary sigma factor
LLTKEYAKIMRQLKISTAITNRESKSLGRYLTEISKIEMLSISEEVALTARIKMGDTYAIERLIKANLRFVISVAKQYQSCGLPLGDLINEGNLGLMKAAMKFDETRGFKFISYAVWWIRQSILMAISEKSNIVRLPLNQSSLNARIIKAYRQLEQEFEREPSEEEIAELLDINKDEIVAALGYSLKHISMDASLHEDEDGYSLIDSMENPNAEKVDVELDYHESLKYDICKALEILPARQRHILRYYFGIGVDYPLSLDEIGEQLNITRERVRQLKDNAICKMQSAQKGKALRVFLG